MLTLALLLFTLNPTPSATLVGRHLALDGARSFAADNATTVNYRLFRVQNGAGQIVLSYEITALRRGRAVACFGASAWRSVSETLSGSFYEVSVVATACGNSPRITYAGPLPNEGLEYAITRSYLLNGPVSADLRLTHLAAGNDQAVIADFVTDGMPIETIEFFGPTSYNLFTVRR